MKERNSLPIRDVHFIHADKFKDELYSEYLNQFKTEVSKEINVDANAKEDFINLYNDDKMNYDFKKRKRNAIELKVPYKS